MISMMGESWVMAKQVLKPLKTSRRPILKWAPVKGATNYKIIVKEIDNTSGQTIDKTTSIISSSYWQSDTDLTGTMYSIKVKSKGVSADALEMVLAPTDCYINVPGEDFQLASNYTNTYDKFNYANASIFSDVGGLVVISDVVIPDGVRLTKMVIYYFGGSSSQIIDVYLYKVPFETTDLTNDTIQLVNENINTEGDTSRLRFQEIDLSSQNIMIDADNWRYQFIAILNQYDGISSVRFYYEGETL